MHAIVDTSYPDMWSEIYANMLDMLDSGVYNVTTAWRDAGLWDNTLMLFTADNGGIGPEGVGGNNHPLRGHKHDAWEGGTRATAFIVGGLVPQALRGTNSSSIISIVDWYATLSTLAGVDPSDNAYFQGM
jgi:arylsulfatase A-like enzyme